MPNDTNFRSRDQLLVTGKFMGERMHFMVFHWPSRRGGEKKSRPKRVQAAILARVLKCFVFVFVFVIISTTWF